MWFSERSLKSGRFGLEAMGVGKQALEPRGGLIDKFRTLSIYALVYLVEGENEFESDRTGVISIKGGQVFFLFPGVRHRYGTRQDQRSFSYWYVYDGALADFHRESGLLRPGSPVFQVGDNKRIRDLAEESIRVSEKGEAGFLDTVSGHLMEVLQEVLVRGEDLKEQRKAPLAVESAIKAMKEGVASQSFDFPRFCAKERVSFEYVRKAFKAVTGFSPGAYFTMLKTASAKTLLMNSKKSAATIARELGFDDPYYFSRWFKKRTGSPPGRYRAGFKGFGN